MTMMRKVSLLLMLSLAMMFDPFRFIPVCLSEANAYRQDVTVYVVKPGDTLWKIAALYQVGVWDLIAANPQLKDPQWIYPGQKLKVPLLTGVKKVEYQVVRLVNQERTKRGLKPLKSNWELSRVARIKSQDMRDRNYFSHTSPTYGSPFTVLPTESPRF